MKLSEIYKIADEIAPKRLSDEYCRLYGAYDNSGVLVDTGDDIKGVLFTLDLSAAAIAKAREMGANLIITHHPVIFNGMKRLDADSIPYRLAAAGISAISAHTNLDKAMGGVNDVLAARLGLTDVEVAADGITRIGTLPEEMSATAFAAHVAEALEIPVRAAGNKPVKKVAVCGGGGGGFIAACFGLADCFVTGEVKHHEWLYAAGHINVIDGGHYSTEVPVVDTLCGWLAEEFPDLQVVPYHEGESFSVVK